MEKISSEDSPGFINSLYDTQKSFSEEDSQKNQKSIVGNHQEIQDRTDKKEEKEKEIHQVISEQESSNPASPSTHSQQPIEEAEEDNYGSATPPSDPITATTAQPSSAVQDPSSTTSDPQVDNQIINNNNNLEFQLEETDTETCNSSPLLGSVNLLYPQSSPKLRFRKLASKSHLQEKSNHFNPNPTSFDNSDPLNNNMNSIPLTNSRRGYLPIGGTAASPASQSQSFGYSLFAWAARKRVLVVILIVGVIIGGQVFLLGPSLVGEEKLRQWGLEGEFWLILPCGRN